MDDKKRLLAEIVGQVMKNVEKVEEKVTEYDGWKRIDGNAILFVTQKGKKYALYHRQEGSEEVTIESIVGDLDDLIGEPLLLAEEIVHEGGGKDDGILLPEEAMEVLTGEYLYNNSRTWTFYKFATRKGYVDIRWCGESNGYYSEEVDFIEEEMK